MTETEEITCIICPTGCKIKVEKEGEEIIKVTGCGCSKGREYAIEEAKAPKRVIMSVVSCRGGDMPTVSVKTDKPVPKEKIEEVMSEISNIEVTSPISIGETIIEDVAGTDANVIATRPA